MAIKFSCPYCKKALAVKDEMAGKKAKCPGCQKILQIPTPKKVTVNADEIAAEVLSDAPKKPPEQQPVEAPPIVFKCYFCDEQISFEAALAGKQAPCPECRRIVKIPVPVKEEPKDWRKVDKKGPSAAKQEPVAAPAGAWGSTTSRSTVSQDALEEADAIKEVIEPLTRREQIHRWTMRVFGVALVSFGLWAGCHITTTRRQDNALNYALNYLDTSSETKLNAESAAEVHRTLGAYYLLVDNWEFAVKHLRNARGKLTQAKAGSLDREAGLRDLALTQADLGGTRAQELDHTRMKWDEAQKEVQQTLQKLQYLESRQEAVREITRKLIAKAGPTPEEKTQMQLRALAVARMLSPTPEDVPELLARAGLELLDDKKQAEDVSRQALRPYEERAAAAAKDKKLKPMPVSPALIALLVASDQTDKAAKSLAPVPDAARGGIAYEARIGYSQGYAYKDDFDRAKLLANASGDASHKLQALLNIAAIAAERNTGKAKELLSMILELLEKERPILTPFMWSQLVRVGFLPDQGDKLQPLIDKLQAGPLKDHVQLEVLRYQLPKNDKADLDGLKAEAGKRKYPRALSLLAEQCAARGSSSAAMKEIAAWEPEALKPLGYAGVALGMESAGRGPGGKP